MKKRIFSMLLSLLLLLSLLPATAMAASGSIWLGGVQMTDGDYLVKGAASATKEVPAVGTSYAHYQNGVLTLNGYSNGDAVWSGDNNYMLYSEQDLTIYISSGFHSFHMEEPDVAGWNYGIYVEGDLTIMGSGYLEVTAGTQSDGIVCTGEMTIEGGNPLRIFAERNGIYADKLTVNAGDISSSASCAVRTNQKSITLNNGMVLYPYSEGYWLEAYDADKSYAQMEFRKPGNIWVGGVELEDGEYLRQGSYAPTTVAPSNNYAYYKDGVLTLKNYAYEGQGAYNLDGNGRYDVIYAGNNPMRIHFIGTNSIRETGAYVNAVSRCIAGKKPIAFTADYGGELTLFAARGYGIYNDSYGYTHIANGTISTSGMSYGIYTNMLKQSGGDLICVGGQKGLVTREFYMDNGIFAAGTTSSGAAATDVDTFAVNESYSLYANTTSSSSGAVKVPISAYEVRQNNYKFLMITQESRVARISGRNRYETAFLTADMLKLGVSGKFSAIIVTSGENFADALPGSYLAIAAGAPILLTDNDNMSDVIGYIQENLEPGGMVYALGGSTIVSDELAAVRSMGFQFKRLAGTSRFETNMAILREVMNGRGIDCIDEPVLVCTAYNFADSLSASSLGMPILLVDDTVSAEQMAFLMEYTSGEFVLVGGTGAVTPAVEQQLNGTGRWVSRLAGADRFETSAMIAEYYGSVAKEPVEGVVMAYGYNFPDGLCAGPLAHALNSPLLLAAIGDEAKAARFAETYGLHSGVVAGGPSLISDPSVCTILGLTQGTSIPLFSPANVTAIVNEAMMSMEG